MLFLCFHVFSSSSGEDCCPGTCSISLCLLAPYNACGLSQWLPQLLFASVYPSAPASSHFSHAHPYHHLLIFINALHPHSFYFIHLTLCHCYHFHPSSCFSSFLPTSIVHLQLCSDLLLHSHQFSFSSVFILIHLHPHSYSSSFQSQHSFHLHVCTS